MKNILYLFVFLLFIASCKKEEAVNTNNIFVDILYTDWEPDPVSKPWPLEGTTLDIDGDSIPDLWLEETSWAEHYDSSGYDVFFVSQRTFVVRIGNNLQIAALTKQIDGEYLNFGDLISDDWLWWSSVNTSGISFWDHPSGVYDEKYGGVFLNKGDDRYLAIRKKSGDNYYYGWIKIKATPYEVIAYEGAMNRYLSKPIKIGQTY